jgi:molybdenum cofactor synthesis domain-containing protein
MQSVNPVLPGTGFAADRLLPPHQAIVAYFARVTIPAPATEYVSLEESFGRVLAAEVVADDDYPNTRRSLMDGFALRAESTPGSFEITGDVRMGAASQSAIGSSGAFRIPTGGILPEGADAVVPIEYVLQNGDTIAVTVSLAVGENVSEKAADMRRGETVLASGRRIRAPEAGVLATLGVTSVPVYRRPLVAVFSSGDELVDAGIRPAFGQIRDSNRYAVAASLRAMGAIPRHYPTLRDESSDFESALERALDECDAVVVSGGSSVGERDRLPRAVAAIGDPGIVVHGLRLRPGKPTLLGAHGAKPILGLPGNPTSALMMLEAVAAPIIAALVGAPLTASTLQARLAQPVRSREGWTWYVPVSVQGNGGLPLAHPLELRSFSVSLTARADGYVIMGERDEEWPAQRLVTVARFFGGP